MHQLDERTTYGILQVNVEGTVRTTRAVVPFLINQRRGAIINVSSGSGNHPTPMISCYASTKVRVLGVWSSSLSSPCLFFIYLYFFLVELTPHT